MADFVLPPSLIANLADWTLIDYSGMQQSPFSGAARTLDRGQRWQAHYQFHDLKDDNRAVLSALMASIRGKSGRMWIADPTYVQRGSFPATELLTNGSFAAGATGWTLTGSGWVNGFNRAVILMTAGAGNVTLSQPVSLTVGAAYAMRSCLIDGYLSTAATLGVQVADSGVSYSSLGLARGLITASGIATSGGTGSQYAIHMTAGATAGMQVISTYASLRRCALAINPAGLTYGTSIPCDALPVSVAGLLRAGDRFAINGEMKTCTFDLNADASGGSILYFEPSLRKIVPDNCPIIIGQPMMKGILMNDAMQVTRPGLFSDFDFTFVEA